MLRSLAGISPLPGSCRTAGRCFADLYQCPVHRLQWPTRARRCLAAFCSWRMPPHSPSRREAAPAVVLVANRRGWIF